MTGSKEEEGEEEVRGVRRVGGGRHTYVATPPLCFAEVVQNDTDQLSACGAGKRFTV
jgi:hypothetical protein